MSQTQQTQQAPLAPALSFPPDFVWGAATASYQVEGAVHEDGRGTSIWDTFSAVPGHVVGGDTGDVACDHYHRYPQDVALAADLGLRAYRFSLAWPRIQPTGSGPVEPRGLAFYDRLVDTLLETGVTPLATLYHWDLPQPLEDAGGWPVRDTAARFAEYAAIAVDHLGDRVKTWSTLNEPFCSSYLGYGCGIHAPGRVEPAQAFAALHHLLLGHGLAVQALRAGARPATDLSLVLNFSKILGASNSPADLDAVRRLDGLHNRLFAEAVLGDGYPQDVLDDTAHVTDWSFVRPGDAATIATPLDWLGVNYYTSTRVAATDDPLEVTKGVFPGLRGARILDPVGPLTSIGWEQYPQGLTDILVELSGRHPSVPLMVTENGSAWRDVITPDGAIHDADRIAYLKAHLAAVHGAIAAGANMRGYLAWSLLDNFEWSEGYEQRFGLVHVDYATQERRLKDSAHAYADIIRRGGLDPD